ncbi:hypothetical protein INT45_011492 [Circinella minor]|uniref:Uncharacterized protein n=1 Tax=Circinella minor TaxID=1195481 RepID=A0A8H7S1K9_9FUNG|nr:hypothetical protein INT45_011492 [Circinella minor]
MPGTTQDTNNTHRNVSCDYKPLQECLLKNNNDRSQCMKEWQDFQQACREKN